MTVGLKDTILNAWLDGLCSSTTWTEPVAFYVKLHTADPGAAGTTAPAGETTRKTCTFAAASGGAITSTSDLAWTNVSTAETYSHISFWDADTAGNFLGSAALTASKTVAIGDNFTIPTGDLDLSITPVAA